MPSPSFRIGLLVGALVLGAARIAHAQPACTTAPIGAAASPETSAVLARMQPWLDQVFGLPAQDASDVWASDASGLVRGRMEVPDAHDLAQSLETIAAYRRAWQWNRVIDGTDAPEAEETAEIECADVEVSSAQAVVRARVAIRYFVGVEIETIGLRAELRRDPEQWRVVVARTWDIEDSFFDDFTVFDAAHWRRLDRAVRRVRGRSTESMRARFYAQRAAHHWMSAFEQGLELCRSESSAAEDCLAVMTLAWFVGRGAEAQELLALANRKAHESARWHETDRCPRGAHLRRDLEYLGELAMACVVATGAREGPVTTLHPDGSPHWIGRFRRDRPVGVWIGLDPTGAIAGRIVH